jgi:hypothetical protein
MPVANDRKQQRGFAGLAALALVDCEPAEAPLRPAGPWETRNRMDGSDRQEPVKSEKESSERKAPDKQSATISTEPRQSEPVSRGSASAVTPPSTFKRNVVVVCCLLLVGALLKFNADNTSQTTQTLPVGSDYPARNDVRPTIGPTPPVSSPSQTQIEAPPWKGDGTRRLTIAMIRWCLFQQRRITYLRQEFDDTANAVDASTYNNMVDDYSDRCAAYQYSESDMVRVRAEVASKELILKAEAARIWASWLRQPSTSVAPSTPDPAERTVRSSQGVDQATLEGSREQVGLDLLRIEDARKVQQRLIALKYLVGPADGLWTSRSRSALRGFKIGNGLPLDDLFDASTEIALFSPSAGKKMGRPITAICPKKRGSRKGGTHLLLGRL